MSIIAWPSLTWGAADFLPIPVCDTHLPEPAKTCRVRRRDRDQFVRPINLAEAIYVLR